MQNKTSRTKPVIIGFALWLFLMCSVSFTAIFSLHAVMQISFVSNEEINAFTKTADALRRIDDAHIAALRLRETNDEQFLEVLHTCFREATESLAFAQDQWLPGWGIEDLMVRCGDFMALCYMDFEIGERLEQTAESTDEWSALHKERQVVREKQDVIADEMKAIGAELLARQGKLVNNFQWELGTYLSRWMTLLLLIIAVVSVLAFVICFVVVRMVGRESLPFQSEDFSYSEPSGDMRIVADQLQEVVNLLRK